MTDVSPSVLKRPFSTKEIINELTNKDGYSPEKSKEIAKRYIEEVREQGMPPGDDEVAREIMEFAIYGVESGRYAFEDSRTARPSTELDLGKYEPEAGKRLEKEISTESDRAVDELIETSEDESFISAARRELESVGESVDDTNKGFVKSEIKNNLRNNLEQPRVKNRFTEIVREYSEFQWSDIERTAIVNKAVKEIIDNRAERISDKIMLHLHDENLSNQQGNVRQGVEKYLRDISEGFSEGATGEVISKLSKQGIKKAIGLITSAILGIEFIL